MSFSRSIALKIIVLGSSFSLLWSGAAWANGCNTAEISSYIIAQEAEAIALNNCEVDALPAVIELIEHEYAFVRSNAIKGLVKISRNVAPTVRSRIIIPTLVEALKDNEDVVRRSAVGALGSLGADGRSAIPALVEAFKQDPQPEVGLGVSMALLNISSALVETKENLSTSDLEQIVNDLNEAEEIVKRDSGFDIPSEYPQFFSVPLVELKQELGSRGNLVTRFFHRLNRIIQGFNF